MLINIIPDYGSSERNGNGPPEEEVEVEEWLTVAQLAARLGIDQKQVRRYAARLDERDRTCPGHVPPPLLLRLSAVLDLRRKGLVGRQSLLPPEDMSLSVTGHVPSEVNDTVKQALEAFRTACERILDEQQDKLMEALEHQRRTTMSLLETMERLTDALEKERAQRALPPPAPSEPSPEIRRTPWWRSWPWWRRK